MAGEIGSVDVWRWRAKIELPLCGVELTTLFEAFCSGFLKMPTKFKRNRINLFQLTKQLGGTPESVFEWCCENGLQTRDRIHGWYYDVKTGMKAKCDGRMTVQFRCDKAKTESVSGVTWRPAYFRCESVVCGYKWISLHGASCYCILDDRNQSERFIYRDHFWKQQPEPSPSYTTCLWMVGWV